METNPRDYGERCRFDAFCKTVLKHEAIDYIREMKRRASRETSLDRLPQAAMDKLPFPCFSCLRALPCVLERGNIFAEKINPIKRPMKLNFHKPL